MTGVTNKSKIRKQDILSAAQKLFFTKGYQETSVNDIMKLAGAAKGAFYYYFDSKDQILDTLVEQDMTELAEAMTVIVDTKELNAVEKLKEMLGTEFRISMAKINPEFHLHDIKNVDMHQRILVSMTYRLAPLFGAVIEQGRKEGIFRICYPLEAAEILLTGIHFITDLGIFRWNREQHTRRLLAAQELMERALGMEQGGLSFVNELFGETVTNFVSAQKLFDRKSEAEDGNK